jgi:hypothetical protein
VPVSHGCEIQVDLEKMVGRESQRDGRGGRSGGVGKGRAFLRVVGLLAGCDASLMMADGICGAPMQAMALDPALIVPGMLMGVTGVEPSLRPTGRWPNEGPPQGAPITYRW